MTGNAHCGRGFGGLTSYLLNGKKDKPNPDRVAWTSTRELALEDPREAALLMRRTAALGRAKDPVEHISVSLAPGEHLSPEQWEMLIDRTLKDLGLEGHQVLIVAHQDTRCEHVHLMINRVHPETLRAWDRWRDQNRVMDSMRLREPEFGLHVNVHVKDPDRLPDGAMKAFIHAAEPPLLDFARAEARPIFKETQSWEELHERLAEVGLYLERKGQGLVVTDDKHYVKASSVDRAASLRALEERLGPYTERRPLLQEVDSDLRGDRQEQLLAHVEPAFSAGREAYSAEKSIQEAARRLDNARHHIRNAIEDAFRDPAAVEARYLAHLNQQRTVPPLRPKELAELKGIVIPAGRTPLALGNRGGDALDIATGQLPRFAAEYLRAQEDLTRAQVRLAGARGEEGFLRGLYGPQLAELREIQARASTLEERILALRPRDQEALLRVHGAGPLETAVERLPGYAERPVEARERWLQNFSPEMDRVLDHRLLNKGLSRPDRDGNIAEWTREALAYGLHPLHAVQALTRGQVPLAEAAHAVSLTYSAARHPFASARGHSARAIQDRTGLPAADALNSFLLTRAMIHSPLQTSLGLTAQALGLPALPVRLASMAWDMVKEQVLSR
jgi:relaxase-like protein/DNA relaxase TraI-like protein